MPSTGQPKIFNPYIIMQDFQHGVQENAVFLIILAILITLIAAFMLNNLWIAYMSTPKRERVFRIGKTSIADTIRQELLQRIKKNKKRPF